MSILIKGMEMPKNCYGCPFFKQVDYWNKNDETDILSKCKRTGEFTWESMNGYLPNCPLVPVPPHGRLGDLDALAESVITPGIFPPVVSNEVFAFLRNAPTIIPADPITTEEEKNDK